MPQTSELGENPSRETERDGFFLPGVFGRMSVFDDAEERMGHAENELDLGNRERARQLLVEFLEQIQTQGWSVWNRPEENVVAAQRQLVDTSIDVSELVRAYKSLILNESHEASWTLADSLIEQCDALLSSNQSEQIFTTVVEHVRLMTGEHTYERNLYGSLGSSPDENDQNSILEFIFWLTSHPKWLRREKAAELLGWLSEYWEDCLSRVAHAAVENGNDVACDLAWAILERLSIRDSERAWSLITANQNPVELSLIHI